MGETVGVARLRAAHRNGVLVLGGVYRRVGDGVLAYDGERPHPGWHRHGSLGRWLWVVEDGTLVRYRLLKQRWSDPSRSQTQHSRPPDDVGFVHACTTVVVLMLWSWLDGVGGIASREAIIEEPSQGYPSSRTLQRWLRRALPRSMETQQTLRHAVIERSEPRPLERLFRGGLSPPEALVRRRWKAPTPVCQLWTGLAILLVGAIELDVSTPLLLAEARGRKTHPSGSAFLI